MCQSNIALRIFCVFQEKHGFKVFFQTIPGIVLAPNTKLKQKSFFNDFPKTYLQINEIVSFDHTKTRLGHVLINLH